MKPAYKILSSLALVFFLVLPGAITIKAQEPVDVDTTIYSIPIASLMNLTLDKASVIGLPHPHSKGFFHIQYSRMIMPMTGFQEGTTELTQDDVFDHPTYNFSGYAPDMMMTMNMFMLMYGLNDNLTIMAMTNYSIITMENMVMKMGSMIMPMTMEPSKGIGDLKLMLNINAYNRDITSVLFNVGVAIPTGSIDQEMMNMMLQTVNKPYPMQLGSGTWDPKVELVYLGSTMRSSWGVGLKSILRLYDNKHGYHLGNRYQVMAGAGHNWAKWIATTARLDYVTWGNISGEDETSIAKQYKWEESSPNHHADLRAGTRFEASAGLVFEVPKGPFEGVSLIFDYRYPIYQNLRGVGMPIDYHFQIALQWIFGEKHLKD